MMDNFTFVPIKNSKTPRFRKECLTFRHGSVCDLIPFLGRMRVDYDN